MKVGVQIFFSNDCEMFVLKHLEFFLITLL